MNYSKIKQEIEQEQERIKEQESQTSYNEIMSQLKIKVFK